MEPAGGCVSLARRTLSRRSVWIYLFLVSLGLPGAQSEMCVYRRNSLNSLTGRYDKLLTTKECQWGCCYNSGSPCCTAPVSLIVGVVLGSVLVFAIVIAALCCCCVCRKHQQRTLGRGNQRQAASSSTTQQTSVIFHTETSPSNDLPEYPQYDDLPPSYDEVMRGEINQAFKPEAA